MSSKRDVCPHTDLQITPSPTASPAGYKQRTRAQLARAAGVKIEDLPSAAIYPAPLVLPDDDLAHDPKYPGQTLQQWQREKHRNPITKQRKTIYVVEPPTISEDVQWLENGMEPVLGSRGARTKSKKDISADTVPKTSDIAAYIRAFYYPMPVKLLPASTFRFTSWDSIDTLAAPGGKSESKKRNTPTAKPYIALHHTPSGSLTRIRLRQSPDNLFPAQLCVSDLLDGLISHLPRDAYSVVMLVRHDLYEDDEDDFICGRAYGGSRVAVVGCARYDPKMDDGDEVAREHAWPASHCKAYVERVCGEAEDEDEDGERKTMKGGESEDEDEDASVQVISELDARISPAGSAAEKPATKRRKLAHRPATHAAAADPKTTTCASVPNLSSIPNPSPLRAAINVFTQTQTQTQTQTEDLRQPSSSTTSSLPVQRLWLSRLVRTTTHELVHTLGLDHCPFYACLMQSTTGMAEDYRQPPYLCPVCRAKIDACAGVMPGEKVGGWNVSRQKDACEVEVEDEHGVSTTAGRRGTSRSGAEQPEREIRGLRRERERMVVEFCGEWDGAGGEMFAAYGAWCEAQSTGT